MLSFFKKSQNIAFKDITQESIMFGIQSEEIRHIYSKFNFKSLNFMNLINDQIEEDLIKTFLFNYLKVYKFITYDVAKSKEDLDNQYKDLIACVEEECIIIESIPNILIPELFQKTNAIAINVTHNQLDDNQKVEIESFINYCKRHLVKNSFVRKTFRAIVSYIIRRYYYPSHFFKNDSFFSFNPGTVSCEQSIKADLTDLFQIQNEKELKYKFPQISNSIKEKINVQHQEKSDEPQIYNFQESEFIKLRPLNKSIHLVIHKKTLFLCAMKMFDSRFSDGNFIDHEIDFDERNKNGYFTKFYGFIRQYPTNKIIGAIYQFMSNDNLESFILNHKEKIDDFTKLTMINRIFQGIDYLHSNNMIHRDLKPSNILIDHDFNVFLWDFETIRQIDDDCEYTYSFGSPKYVSPEQMNGTSISFPTDIYSFGLIVYFIYEGKHRYEYEPDFNEKSFKEMENGPKELQELYKACIRYDPSERPTKEEIKEVLLEVNSFNFLEQNLVKQSIIQIERNVFIQYFAESILLNSLNDDMYHAYMNYVSLFCEAMMQNDYSKILCCLGAAFLEGDRIEENFTKSRQYFALSKELNNSDALYYIGIMYLKGNCVEKSFEKAEDYFIQAMKQRNGKALFQVGLFCYRGNYYKKNFERAKNLFELAMQENMSEACICLGTMYSNGQGVSINYSMAKKCFERAAELKDPDGVFILGTIYHFGQGVLRNYSKAREYYELAASMNNSRALLNLGNLYREGLGVHKDYQKMLECYERSAKLGNSDAYYIIGLAYYKGIGAGKDYLRAKQYFEKAAEANNHKAQCSLGQFYDEGLIGDPDYIMAKKYYELSAIQGNSDALNNLGMIYYYGKGVNQDTKKAIEYLELAAEHNDSNALFNLGFIYYEGKEIEKDYSKAKYFLEQSAKQNNPRAIMNLAVLYFDDKFPEHDYKKSIKYAEHAAKLNISNAYIFLGNIYLGKGAGEPNYAKSKKYYEKAIEMNNPEGYYFLGLLYSEGKGVKQDYIKAKELYEIAAKHNNVNAIINIGDFYFQGKGVEKNYSKAKEYFEQAAKFNDETALINLANIYYNGIGTPRDFLRAKYYYELCAKKNNSQALVNLGDIYFEGKEVEKDLSKGIEYFEAAAKLDNVYALYILGTIYYEGKFVEKDLTKSLGYLQKASYLKHSYSLYYLGLIYYHQGELSNQNYIKAREYFDLSVKYNNPSALFYLGFIYENGKGVEKDISKAIEYYTKSASIHYFNDRTVVLDKANYSSFAIEINMKNLNYNRSINDLGLIYITENQDVKLAEKYLKEAAFNEYPFGQNNLGLLFEFYLNSKYDAKHMYERSCEKHFALAHFNLGHFYEKEENIEEAFNQYRLASQYENSVYMFRDQIINDDERLNLSKTFLICFTNLKLVQLYLNNEPTPLDIEIAKEYLFKAIFNPLIRLLLNQNCISYSFHFRSENEKISNINDFFLNFPLFNVENEESSEWKLIEQSSDKKKVISILHNEECKSEENDIISNKNNQEKESLIEKLEEENNIVSQYNKRYLDTHFKEQIESIIKEMNDQEGSNKINLESNFDEDSNVNTIRFKKKEEIERIFEYDNNLYNNLFVNIETLKIDIDNILKEINSIIYKQPYNILFGRIKQKQDIKNTNEINQSFYDGLGI